MMIELLFLLVLTGLLLSALVYATYALFFGKRRKKRRHPLDIKPAARKTAAAQKS